MQKQALTHQHHHHSVCVCAKSEKKEIARRRLAGCWGLFACECGVSADARRHRRRLRCGGGGRARIPARGISLLAMMTTRGWLPGLPAREESQRARGYLSGWRHRISSGPDTQEGNPLSHLSLSLLLSAALAPICPNHLAAALDLPHQLTEIQNE